MFAGNESRAHPSCAWTDRQLSSPPGPSTASSAGTVSVSCRPFNSVAYSIARLVSLSRDSSVGRHQAVAASLAIAWPLCPLNAPQRRGRYFAAIAVFITGVVRLPNVPISNGVSSRIAHHHLNGVHRHM